jgi:hypothetical protein
MIILFVLVTVVGFAFAHDVSAEQKVIARYPVHIRFTSSTLSNALAAHLNQCKLQFHFTPGMTNAEANNEVDAAYDRFFHCLFNAPARSRG